MLKESIPSTINMVFFLLEQRSFMVITILIKWSLTGFPRANLLDKSLSVLHFEKDNLPSLANVCKMYILKAKQIRTNSISRKVWDDQFLQILIDCRWNWNNRDGKLSFSKCKTDRDLSRRLARGKPVRLHNFMTTQQLKKALCGNILDWLKQKMNLQLKAT
jgi:hypothetical protein